MEPQTIAFDAFWKWVTAHPNCIVRAGTPETVLYDDEDLHWHFANEGPNRLVVQLMRGKRMLGELLLEPDLVTYVEATTGEQEGEFLFDLVSESESERVAAYFFVLSHGFEKPESSAPSRVH